MDPNLRTACRNVQSISRLKETNFPKHHRTFSVVYQLVYMARITQISGHIVHINYQTFVHHVMA